MSKTVESYRMALEDEISRWHGFAKVLREVDRAAFETLMDACRKFAPAGSNSVNPVFFEPMVMSIMLNQQVHIQGIEKELDALKRQFAEP